MGSPLLELLATSSLYQVKPNNGKGFQLELVLRLILSPSLGFFHSHIVCSPFIKGFSCGLAGKESAHTVGELGLIPGLGRSPGEGKGYPLQYSGLENSMYSIIHGVAKSQTWLSDFHSLPSLSYHIICGDCHLFCEQSSFLFMFCFCGSIDKTGLRFPELQNDGLLELEKISYILPWQKWDPELWSLMPNHITNLLKRWNHNQSLPNPGQGFLFLFLLP